MSDVTVSTAIDAKVARKAMLAHPFYQAWTEGRLPLCIALTARGKAST